MKTLPKIMFSGWIAFCALAPSAISSQTEPALRVESIQLVEGGALEFTFRDAGSGASAFRVEYSLSLGLEVSWSHDTSAVITPLGNDEYRVVVPEPTGSRGFYRVVGFGIDGEDVVVQFATTAFQITEGETAFPVITFSAPFTGTLRYHISGTATTDDFGTLIGEIQVFNSTTATLPITISENETIDPLRVLILTLEADAGTLPGLNSRMVIMIEDRDARWEGTLMTDRASLPFSLEIIRTGETTHGRLVGGSSHFFPEGPFSGTITAHAPAAFTAFIGGIPLPAESTLLGLQSELTLFLNAIKGDEGHEVGEHFIMGDAVFETSYAGHPHLTTTNEGTFLMQRVPPPPSESEVELTPAP